MPLAITESQQAHGIKPNSESMLGASALGSCCSAFESLHFHGYPPGYVATCQHPLASILHSRVPQVPAVLLEAEAPSERAHVPNTAGLCLYRSSVWPDCS